MTAPMLWRFTVPAFVLLLAGCRDEEPEPDVQAVIGDLCAVYQACEPETPYATADECEASEWIDINDDDEACREVKLVYYECVAPLTCEEYTALREPTSGATCSDEQTAYILECEF